VHEVHVHASLMDAFRAISGSSALIWLIAAGTAATILALGTTTWIAVFTIRNLGLAPTEAGLLVGLLMGGASVVGNLAGGFAADRLGKKRIRSVMLVPAVGSALAVPFAVAAFMADRPMSFALLYFIPAAAGLLWSPPFLHLIQRLSPAPVRATVTQMGVVVMSLVGLGLGPLLVGIGSDLLADTHGVESLRYALIAASFWGLVTAAILWRSGCLAERSLLTNPEA
jgi:MFS family permease